MRQHSIPQPGHLGVGLPGAQQRLQLLLELRWQSPACVTAVRVSGRPGGGAADLHWQSPAGGTCCACGRGSSGKCYPGYLYKSILLQAHMHHTV